MTKIHTTYVQENEDGEYYIEFSEEILAAAGLNPGDTVKWTDNGDGSWSITKVVTQETELVLVEAVSMFRMRYLVEVPKGKSEWALDTVVMNEAKEFSQEHLGENIVSNRVISKEDALELCRADNEYMDSFSDEKLMDVCFTKIDSSSDGGVENDAIV